LGAIIKELFVRLKLFTNMSLVIICMLIYFEQLWLYDFALNCPFILFIYWDIRMLWFVLMIYCPING